MKIYSWVISFLFVISLIININLVDKIYGLEDRLNDITNKKNFAEECISVLQNDKDELINMNLELEVSLKRANNLVNSLSNSSSYSYTQPSNTHTTTNMAVVVYQDSGCDYIILKNNVGYILAQCLSAFPPDIGVTLTGNFHSYCKNTFVNASSKSSCDLWIEGYMLSEDDAVKEYKRHCK